MLRREEIRQRLSLHKRSDHKVSQDQEIDGSWKQRIHHLLTKVKPSSKEESQESQTMKSKELSFLEECDMEYELHDCMTQIINGTRAVLEKRMDQFHVQHMTYKRLDEALKNPAHRLSLRMLIETNDFERSETFCKLAAFSVRQYLTQNNLVTFEGEQIRQGLSSLAFTDTTVIIVNHCEGTLNDCEMEHWRQFLTSIDETGMEACFLISDATFKKQLFKIYPQGMEQVVYGYLGQNHQMDDLIGLDEIKNVLKNLKYRTQYEVFLKEKAFYRDEVIHYHMALMGNPGTGKTTVARMIAHDLYEAHIIPEDKLTVVSRANLIDDHIGGSEVNTNEIVEEALGGVLFIDEAYALFHGDDDTKDYGNDLINVLIAKMDEHQGELVMIFAGYENKMESLLTANDGLRSRIKYQFYLPDFTLEELETMYLKKMERLGFITQPDIQKKLKQVIAFFMKEKDFGNGRFIDHLVDQTINKRSRRPYNEMQFDDITAEDIPTIDEMMHLSSDQLTYKRMIHINEEDLRRMAVHEMGHAISAYELKLGIVKKISLEDAYGESSTRVDYDEGKLLTIKDLENALVVKMAGRCAENLVYHSYSVGCQSDLEDAKALACHMIRDLGVGLSTDVGVNDLLKEAHQKAESLLSYHQDTLLRLAEDLMKAKTISQEMFEDLYLSSYKKVS